MEKEQNYFVINKYSNYWDGNTDNKFNYIYDNQEYISLKPNYSYRAKKTVEINLETIGNEIRNFSDNARSKNVNEKYFLCFDGSHFLYILEKDTKKIRRINIDLYKNDKNKNQDFQKKNLSQGTFLDAIYDEYIIDCKYLENPQMLFVGNTKIYVLDNTKIYVLSKLPNFQIIRIIQFIKKIQFFTISNNEQILFFSYLNEKNRLYKRDLKFEEYHHQIEKDGRNENNISMIIDIDDKINPEHATTKDQRSNNFLDVIINNKLNHLIGLTTSAIFIYDFKGYFISKWEFQQIKANLNYFNPTCITIDEQEDEIFIGNGNNGESAFSIKIKYGLKESIDQKIDSSNTNKRLEYSNKDEYRFNYEFLKYNGRSSRIFHSRIKNKCCSKNNQNARIIIANIISKEETIQNNHDICKDDNFVDNIKNTPRIQYINNPDLNCGDWNNPTDILKIMNFR